MALLAFSALFLFYYAGDLPAREGGFIRVAEGLIWLVFTVDYIVRLLIARDKRTFFKANIFELIAILPLGAGFRLARIAGLVKVLRLTAYLARFIRRVREISIFTNLFYIFIAAVSLIVLAALFIGPLEGMTFFEALYWAVVTVGTVGYGDLAPATVPGRLIAITLIISGIGLISITTGALTTHLIGRSSDRRRPEADNPILAQIQAKLAHLETLSDEEIDDMAALLKLLKKNL